MSDNKSTEGLPMYVQSLMTPTEWNERMKHYKTSHLKFLEAHKEKPNSMKWRKETITQDEREKVNASLDQMRKKAGI